MYTPNSNACPGLSISMTILTVIMEVVLTLASLFSCRNHNTNCVSPHLGVGVEDSHILAPLADFNLSSLPDRGSWYSLFVDYLTFLGSQCYVTKPSSELRELSGIFSHLLYSYV